MLTRARWSYWRDENSEGVDVGAGTACLRCRRMQSSFAGLAAGLKQRRKDDLGKSVVLVVAGTCHLQDGTGEK